MTNEAQVSIVICMMIMVVMSINLAYNICRIADSLSTIAKEGTHGKVIPEDVPR